MLTYPQLCTAITAWVDTQEVIQNVATFITLAEAQINRRLRCREMWGVTSINLACERAPLPSDFLSVESLKGPRGKLTYVSPQMMDEHDHPVWGGDGEWFGHRREYTLAGPDLVFPCLFAPDASAPPCEIGRLRYVRRVPPLGPQNVSNWLLERSPDVYLYGALAQTAGFLKEDNRAVQWLGRFNAALQEIEAADVMTSLDSLEPKSSFSSRHAHDRWEGW